MMGKQELRTFQYTCDGHTRDGQPCETHTTILAATAYEADHLVTKDKHQFTGWRWYITAPNHWLCPNWAHRNDPRAKDGK